jgi:hypothetical protein
MYNLYINTTGSNNKGTFKIDYRNKPLFFEEGTKIAFNNMLMYNSINNISANLGNNVIYILVEKYDTSGGTGYDGFLPVKKSGAVADSDGFFETSVQSQKDYPEFEDVYVKEFTSNKIYKIILPDGQYSIDALDEAIALRMIVDIDPNTRLHSIKDDDSRVLMITADPTYGKVKFMFDYYTDNSSLKQKFDIVFPVNNFDIKSSIAKFLGVHTMTEKHNLEIQDGNTPTGITEEWYSYNKSSAPDTSGLALEKADVNNGITSLNIRIRGGLFNGGYDSLSHESDTLHSFNITASPGYPQDISPNSLVFLDILAVNRPINYLDFRITDQNGREIGEDITEDLSMVITIKEPSD